MFQIARVERICPLCHHHINSDGVIVGEPKGEEKKVAEELLHMKYYDFNVESNVLICPWHYQNSPRN